MAVSLDVVEKSLEDLEKEVTCAVCQEHYTDPKILPCLHYYCKQCILRLALGTLQDEPFSCPECRKDTTLPAGGIEELQSAFFINRLKSIFIKHKKALSKQVQCEMCTKQTVAEAFCQQCDKFACKNCVHMHSVMKPIFGGHEIVSIDQLQKVNVGNLVPNNPKPRKCQLHDELLKIFCFDCSKLICRDCTVKDHKDHNIEFNNVAADNKKKELMESLKPLREVENSLSQALKEVRNTEREVEGQGDSVANTIKTSFEELHTILETRKQQLLEEARKRVREKIENLKGQEKNLSIACAEIRSVIDYTEQCVRLCSDEEVMSMHTEISRQVNGKINEHDKAGKKLEPVEVADVGVNLESLNVFHHQCQKASIRVLHPVDFIRVNNIPSLVEVGKIIRIDLVNTMKKRNGSALNLECRIKYLPTGSCFVPKIVRDSSDKYKISYTPSVRGCHELSISAYGQPVPGSPFTMTVYMSPAQLDKPVKVWDGVARPNSVAVNSVGEVIVAEFSKNIVVFDAEGRKLRSIERSQHQVSGLRSITVDNEDNVYFVGETGNRLGKSNRSCDKLLIREVQQIKGPGYLDVAVVGDEVMVTEFFNEGQIMVYDKDLSYVRQICCSKKTRLRHLCPDHLGNLYVTDNNFTVQVLSTTGDLLCFFSCDRSNKCKLKNPYMIHVCGQYVYVADFILNKIIVYTTEQNYVTMFDFWGDICVSHDGIWYMCDFSANKIASY